MSREGEPNKRQGSHVPLQFWLLMSCSIFAALAEFESEVIGERKLTGSQAACTRGRDDSRNFALMKARVRTAPATMAGCDMSVPELCNELGIQPATHSSTTEPEDSPATPDQDYRQHPASAAPRIDPLYPDHAAHPLTIIGVGLDFKLYTYRLQAVMQGGPLATVVQLPGQSQVAMTLRYARSYGREIEVAAERSGPRSLNDLFFPPYRKFAR